MKTKLAFLWFYDAYNSVMNHNKNPLRHIPDPLSRMWIMTVLAWMWSIVFGLYVGSVIYMGISLAAHFILLFMLTFTAAVFYDAERRHDSWLLNLRLAQQARH
ncbi:MAG: hypothetical protein P8H31_10120 [Porticoccaceae bacterium]|nr:hypothetical protein [Porticoccaceae bacterium]